MACPECNLKKNNRIPPKDLLAKIVDRNKDFKNSQKNKLILIEFAQYSDDLLSRMWNYAKLSGFKEYERNTI